MIPFNRPPLVGTELDYIQQLLITQNKLSGDGFFSRKCQHWLEENLQVKKTLLTPSCTAALEMSALLIDIQPGDEVIMPSFTFVSTANAFVLRGAKIVFVDICPKTMNIDSGLIEDAINSKTKAIVVVHYAGVACDMSTIMTIADRYNLYVIEDAAQGIMSSYKDRPLGSIGHLGCLSFHDTKNCTAGGEGGALLINDEFFIERAEILREKGTNRSQFLRGQVDKYTWHDIGSSYLPSELQAAYLFAQLEASHLINDKRLKVWNSYHNAFAALESNLLVERPYIPEACTHNAHLYFLKMNSLEGRDLFISQMKELGVQTVFHYVPLHSSPAGKKYGIFRGKDLYTTKESERLVRLPLWFNINDVDIASVIENTMKCVLGASIE